MIEQTEVHWQLNSYCEYRCDYCPGKWSAGSLDRNIDEYITVVEKLQVSRYKNCRSIGWHLTGGEPLNFPNIHILLRTIKSQPSQVTLETSGGDNWFGLVEITQHVDYFKVTHHDWQNVSTLHFIADYCKENNKKLKIFVPLTSGKILEKKQLVQELRSQGFDVEEQVLKNENYSLWSGYKREDINLMAGRRADEDPPPLPPSAAPAPAMPTEPVYVDLSKPATDGSPSYTGRQCYAGVDYITIDAKGWARGSDCHGRVIGNVFDADWTAPDTSFACPMTFCRSINDRQKIRIDQ